MAKSAYQKRIEKALAGLSIEMDARTIAKFSLIAAGKKKSLEQTIQGDDEFTIESAYRSPGMKCELCGHNPIKNVFVLKHKTNHNKLNIGCECAKNYIDADLVDAVCKEYDFEYRKIVNPIKFEDYLPALEWAREYKGAARLSSVRSQLSKFINYGNPSNILAKINGGKTIGKREKEVLEFWKHVYENQDAVAVVHQISNLINATRRYYIELKYEAQRNKRITSNFFSITVKRDLCTFVQNFFGFQRRVLEASVKAEEKPVEEKPVVGLTQKALDNCKSGKERDFVNQCARYRKVGRELTPAQQSWFDSILTRGQEIAPENNYIQITLNKIKGCDNLTEWEISFHKSVCEQYEKRGSLSPKQIKTVNRIAKKVVA